ncbi:acetyltransferase [Pyxidicoccus parkwayensis]|uniref:Serine acetyltransferase n=1 Tax=Pyxidicoccus parkwayensis TaxID=2813578 RepID=A0ABX7NY57_9BACT|nr:DapH/DapD/GlmU-related protein [Pyxidicoccus parkwaysis]QSQ23832.1 acetyltransferase [Pyxidicoccus parkwaysis]
MGPTALTFYRAAKRLKMWRVPVLPGVMAALGKRVHQCHVDLEARLHTSVELGYGGMGVVVAPGVEIGEGSFLSQNVSVEPEFGVAGVPKIGRNVFVGVGAKILGPVTVGDGAVIGANAVVTSDVAPGAVVAGIPARELKRASHGQREERGPRTKGLAPRGTPGR